MSAEEYEQRFNCIVCLCPKLNMVYGSCQHRVCADCIYDSQGYTRPSMETCPTCQKERAFPLVRPNIPEDILAIQRCLGVRACTNSGCSVEMWQWEVEDHERICPSRQKTPKQKRQSLCPVSSQSLTKRAKNKDQGKGFEIRVTRSNTFNGRMRPQVQRRRSMRNTGVVQYV